MISNYCSTFRSENQDLTQITVSQHSIISMLVEQVQLLLPESHITTVQIDWHERCFRQWKTTDFQLVWNFPVLFSHLLGDQSTQKERSTFDSACNLEDCSIDEGIAGWAAVQNTSVYIIDPMDDPRFCSFDLPNPPYPHETGYFPTESPPLLIAPIPNVESGAMGVLRIVDIAYLMQKSNESDESNIYQADMRFTEEVLQQITVLCTHAAMLLHLLHLCEQNMIIKNALSQSLANEQAEKHIEAHDNAILKHNIEHLSRTLKLYRGLVLSLPVILLDSERGDENEFVENTDKAITFETCASKFHHIRNAYFVWQNCAQRWLQHLNPTFVRLCLASFVVDPEIRDNDKEILWIPNLEKDDLGTAEFVSVKNWVALEAFQENKVVIHDTFHPETMRLGTDTT